MDVLDIVPIVFDGIGCRIDVDLMVIVDYMDVLMIYNRRDMAFVIICGGLWDGEDSYLCPSWIYNHWHGVHVFHIGNM